MSAVVSRPRGIPERKRRAHGKSRNGCGNCKLRRIKCDESKPRCRKCLSYGVSCDYDGKGRELDIAAHGSFQVDFSSPAPVRDLDVVVDDRLPSLRTPVSLTRNTANMVEAALNATIAKDAASQLAFGVPFCTFNEADLKILSRFMERTVTTIGTSKTAPTYRNCICHLAFSYPFLMHMILSLTLMHDAFLARSHSSSQAASYQHTSLHHWNIATKLFFNILSRPLPPSYRDAVWATGALLGAAGFAYVESSDANESWPLKPSDPNDLDWLKLSEGKKAIWDIADPTRPDSVFYIMSQGINHTSIPSWATHPNLDAIPRRVRSLFNVASDSTIQNNTYLYPILILMRVQHTSPNHDNILDFLCFMAQMGKDFMRLLQEKDPRALLLLLWWFRKLENGSTEMWWVKRRAEVEGEAVERWLERWCGGEGRSLYGEELGWVLDWVRWGDDEGCCVQ